MAFTNMDAFSILVRAWWYVSTIPPSKMWLSQCRDLGVLSKDGGGVLYPIMARAYLMARKYVATVTKIRSLCPLHISRSDGLIGLRHSRRQIGTAMWHISDVASGRHSHLQNGGNAYICVSWYSEGVLFIATPCERQLHCTCCSSRAADSFTNVSR